MLSRKLEVLHKINDPMGYFSVRDDDGIAIYTINMRSKGTKSHLMVYDSEGNQLSDIKQTGSWKISYNVKLEGFQYAKIKQKRLFGRHKYDIELHDCTLPVTGSMRSGTYKVADDHGGVLLEVRTKIRNYVPVFIVESQDDSRESDMLALGLIICIDTVTSPYAVPGYPI